LVHFIIQNSWTLVNILIMWQLKNIKCQEYFKNDPLIETCFTLFTTYFKVQLGDIVNVGNIRQMTMQLKNAFKLISNYRNFILKLKKYNWNIAANVM
jgi:hypothetical protein